MIEKKHSKNVYQRKNKNLFFIVAIFIILVTFLLSAYLIITNSKKTNLIKTSTICSGDESLMKDASKYLESSDINSLASLAEKIAGFKDFDKDPACLYILVYYYVNRSDAINSKNYLNKLKPIYDPNIFTKYSQTPILNVDELFKIVDGLTSITNTIHPSAGSVK